MTIKHSLIISFFILAFSCVASSRYILAQKIQPKTQIASVWDQLNQSDRDLFGQIYNEVKSKIASEFSDDDLEKDVIRGKNGEIIKLAGSLPASLNQGDSNLPMFSSNSSTKAPFKTPSSTWGIAALSTTNPQATTFDTSLSSIAQTSQPTSSSPNTLASLEPVVEATPAPVVEATPIPTPIPQPVYKPKKVVQPKKVLAQATPAPVITQTSASSGGPITNSTPTQQVTESPKQESKKEEKSEQKHEQKNEEHHQKHGDKKD